MKIKVPVLTLKRLKWVMSHVDDKDINPTRGIEGLDEGDVRLLRIIKLMQIYNIEHRTSECSDLFRLFSQPYFLDGNSEGTTSWLAMALTIKELYALDDEQLQKLLYRNY